EEEGNAWMFDAFSTRILSNPSVFLLDPKTRWQEQIRMANIDKYADILCNYEWNWLSSIHGFIMGDNPLVRWNERLGRWNMGIATPRVEITLPLAHNLCLRMNEKTNNKSIKNVGQVIPCKRQQTRIYNRRQRIAAISFVYAGERKLLEPWRSLWWPETKAVKKNAWHHSI
ncbi:MAG: hypothetical protein JWP03_1166, partial [Phycisphaerales bacterium]|nr:hypothetical protein [Phycisphaerales bacterium]